MFRPIYFSSWVTHMYNIWKPKLLVLKTYKLFIYKYLKSLQIKHTLNVYRVYYCSLHSSLFQHRQETPAIQERVTQHWILNVRWISML